MALMVIKSTDFRMNVEQIVVAKAMKKFLENLAPKSTFLCLTHCDESPPKPTFIKEKLESIKKYCGLQILPENVVLFKKTADSLSEFVDAFVQGEMHIVEEEDEEIEEFKEMIEETTKQYDRYHQTNESGNFLTLVDMW